MRRRFGSRMRGTPRRSSAMPGSRTSKTDCRSFRTSVLNQARVHDFYLDLMHRSATKLEPHYARRVIAVQPVASGSEGVSVTLERLDSPHQGLTETVRARF